MRLLSPLILVGLLLTPAASASDPEALSSRRRPVRRPAAASLLQPSDFHYLGAFRLPQGGERPHTFAWGGGAMTWNPRGDPSGSGDGHAGSLLITGHDRMPYGELPEGDQVAEVTIPKPSMSRDVAALPVAVMLQNFHDVSGGLFPTLAELPRVAMQFLSHPATGDVVHLAWGQHFQEDAATAVASHAFFSLPLTTTLTRGAWFIGNETLYSVNGYMLAIPSDWASAHAAGRLLGTGRFRDGGWSGMGPALFAYAPWDATGAIAAAGARLPQTTLLRYESSEATDRIENALRGYQHADAWEGAAWLTTPSGREAVAFAGTKGVGARYWYGYVNPASADLPCVDGDFVGQFTVCRLADGTPCPGSDLVECSGHTSERGWWSSRFEAQILLYAPSDLARVASGERAASQPQPYATVSIDAHLFLNPARIELDAIGSGAQQRYRIGEMTFDQQNQFLYVLELFADEAAPVVHVFRID